MTQLRQIVSGIFLLLTGCAVLQNVSPAHRAALTIEEAKEIHTGKTNRADLLARFGKPDRVIEASQNGSKVSGEIWAYFEDDDNTAGRVAVVISPVSGVVETVSWDVRSRDPEQELDVALSRFPGRRFLKSFLKWENPHFGPDEIVYCDSTDGLAITYRQASKKVASISWSLPERRPTDDSRSQPPASYCLVGLCAQVQNE